MGEAGIDQVATIKASLELMLSENEEAHEYFTDLLEKMSELEALEPEKRRDKFKNLIEMGAFKFNGLDIRHFTHSQSNKPLPPPVFLSRTKRRLKNTGLLIEEFEKRGALEKAEELREQLELLSSHIIDEHDTSEVMKFRSEVEDLRNSDLFQAYMEQKKAFVHKDANFKADSEFIAAKESVEEGEEMLRQRGEELSELGDQIEKGEVDQEEATNMLDKLAYDKT